MEVNSQYITTIEKLTNQGYGLARINNFTIFVENACPLDEVKIQITKLNKSYGYAKISEIIKASPYRIKPFCPMQNVCGACQLQFIDYACQLEQKRQIVKETMQKIGNIDIEINSVIPSPEQISYRHKIQYPISQTKNSKRILAGYYKPSTHEIVNIKYCPIQPRICDEIIDFIRRNAQKYSVSGFDEKTNTGFLRHVVIRNSYHTNQNLVILVVNNKNITNNIKDFACEIYNKFKEDSGVCVNFNTKSTNVIFGNKTETLIGKETIEEKLLDKTFLIAGETFFQVNPSSAENIFAYVKNYIKDNFENPTVLDAYAGISAFGICVSDICKNVVSIEENLKSVELAKSSAKINNVRNIEIHGGDAGEYFAKEKRKFDIVILDPPRKGCSEKSLDEAYKLCNNTIIYISCNPATLARDLKYLANKGCNVKSIQPFDMFCHTYHIENVAIISCH